jgi:hypothetical protein
MGGIAYSPFSLRVPSANFWAYHGFTMPIARALQRWVNVSNVLRSVTYC